MTHILTTLGLAAIVAALSTGTALAGCPDRPADYPESKGWSAVDDTVTVPAGSACDVEVKMRFRGHERRLLNGVPVDEKTRPPRAGDVTVTQSPDLVVRLTNTSTGRTINRAVTGSFTDRVLPNGKDLSTVGRGKNVFFAPGVRGILWADGVQKLSVRNFQQADFSITVTETKGRTVELCTRLGARPVEGKPLPAASAPSQN